MYHRKEGEKVGVRVRYIHWIGVQHVQIRPGQPDHITPRSLCPRCAHSPDHFFFPFFFFTPPVDVVGVLGRLEPCMTGEIAAGCA